MTKPWTKGPWRLVARATMNVENEDGRTVANAATYSGGDESIHYENQANARLIAAAPELYEALEELTKRVAFQPAPNGITAHINFDQIKMAKAAIAKARGE